MNLDFVPHSLKSDRDIAAAVSTASAFYADAVETAHYAARRRLRLYGENYEVAFYAAEADYYAARRAQISKAVLDVLDAHGLTLSARHRAQLDRDRDVLFLAYVTFADGTAHVHAMRKLTGDPVHHRRTALRDALLAVGCSDA